MNKTRATVQFWALLILAELMLAKQDTFWLAAYLILAILTFLYLLFSKEE
jgi:hypothetical protein